jgi:gliding motility-associated-like protein
LKHIKLLKYFISIILLVWAFSTNAQTNNSFSSHYEGIYSFNSERNLVHKKTLNYFQLYSISNFKGKEFIKVAYNLNFDSILLLNFDDNPIKNSYFHVKNEPLSNTNLFTIDSNKILYLSLNEAKNQILYSFITIQNNDLLIHDRDKNIIIDLPDFVSQSNINATRNKDGNIILVIRTKNNFLKSFEIKYNRTPVLINSVDLSIYEKKIDSLDYNPLLNISYNNHNLIVSNSGNYIFMDFIKRYEIKRNKITYAVHTSNNLFEYNKENGTIQFANNIESSFSHLLNSSQKTNNIFKFSLFSPNDSFIYFSMLKSNFYSNSFEKNSFIQYDIYNQRQFEIRSDIQNNNGFFINGFLLNKYGEIIYNVNDREKVKFKFNKITYSNLKFPICQDIVNPYQIYFDYNYPIYSRHLYDYLRTDHSITYDCKATVQIKNNSQPWIGFTDFKWHILNDKGQEEYYTTKEPPTLTYTKNGDYYIKLFGYSPRGKGYGEWYIDTIKVRIPPKPVANFYAQDSIVCRYKDLQFNNYSTTQQSTSEEYLWTFGDGNTSTNKNPTHQYTKTGIYTVTLHYKNGYCDSTLTKNQYITVVDAPKPGFTINTTQGCAPLNIMITDTVKRHVSAKDYFISDGSAWVNIPNGQTQLSHTFTQVGKYRAVQRLMGYTGCVTMSDSVWIHVSQGLTPSDTLDVQWSTIITNEVIGITGKSKLYNIVPGNALISWQSQAGAVKYQLYKDGSPYAQTTDTFYNDPRLYLQDATYTVQGIDSCGNSSSEGRVGKPVFLKSNLQGNNESVLVQYSPYLDLPKGINSLQYQLEKLVDNNGITQWQPIAQHSQVQTHTDININEQGHLQACYRVAVKANTATISTSNVSCSPYEPVIYIPTAFTPNNDGVNDVYEPMYYGIQSYQLTVYNRWGEQVFVGKDKQAWTGENAAEGVYAVIVEYRLNNSIKKTQTTTVTLLR